MEASLARKRINAGLANGAQVAAEAPVSPATSGAMDSLLEKLRAAAPQAKDQRDRRRRARLKERHQVRVASGQKIPDPEDDDGADEVNDEEDVGAADTNASDSGLLSPPLPETEGGGGSPSVSESEDVADRAASMLQGLRDNPDPERTRRRRESAEDERRKRRMRRRNGATSGSKGSNDTAPLSPVTEPTSTSLDDSAEPDSLALSSPTNGEDPTSNPPAIVLSNTPDDNQRPSSS